MNKKEALCPQCEAEFYVETDDDILFCVSCGESLKEDDDWLEEYEADEWIEDED